MALVERFISPTGAGAHDGLAAGSAWDLPEALTNLVASQKGNAIKGNYARTTAVDKPSNAGTAAGPIIIAGYFQNIGDLDKLARQNNGTGEIDLTNFPNFDYTTGRLEANTRTMWQNLHITSETVTTDKAAMVIDTTNVLLHNCKIHNDKGGSSSQERTLRGNAADLSVIGCDLESGGTGSHELFQVLGGSTIVTGCRLRDSGSATGSLLRLIGSAPSILGCVFWGSSGDRGLNITVNADVIIQGCTFYNIGNECIKKGSVGNITTIRDCVAWIMNEFIEVNASDAFMVNNAAGNITTARLVGTGDWPEINPITLTAIPFVDAPNGDFRLNTLADGGQLCRGAGAFGGDLGAIQSLVAFHQEMRMIQ